MKTDIDQNLKYLGNKSNQKLNFLVKKYLKFQNSKHIIYWEDLIEAIYPLNLHF